MMTLECPDTLQPDLVKKAEKELMEKPSWRARDIQALRQMVLDDPELVSRADDEFLLLFLRARKFDYDRAFRLLRHYYSMRVKYPHIFQNFVPSTVKDVFAENMQGFLKDRDDDGRAVFVYRGGLWNTSRFSCDAIIRANLMCLEKIIEQPDIQINGIVAILDMNGLGLQHVRHFTPGNARQTVSIIQDSFPARFKAIHFVNEPALFDIIYTIAKPFLSEKLKQRMYFHGTNMRSLHDHLPPRILPTEYGGVQGPFSNHEWVAQLMASEETFRHNTKFGFLSSKPTSNELRRTDPLDGFLSSYRRVCIQ